MPNRLQHENSPYLLQHACNPVDWYPWGEEAFRKARKEDKPVFLSIGCSTCHWCHVMAHESFEDEETADLMNRCFVSVKVDKEERSDGDGAYMAFCRLYLVSGREADLEAAKRADQFLSEKLMEGDTLYVSYRKRKRGVKGFPDDYAAYLFAQLALYGATLEGAYMAKAGRLCCEVKRRFRDEENGGYFFYGADHEPLILRPKETYDGAIPSGNSLMAWNLVRLVQLQADEAYEQDAQRQPDFLVKAAAQYPAGHAMFLLALLGHENPTPRVTVAPGDETNLASLPLQLPMDAAVILQEQTDDYPLKNGKTTFYVCHGRSCLPPTNELSAYGLADRGEHCKRGDSYGQARHGKT